MKDATPDLNPPTSFRDSLQCRHLRYTNWTLTDDGGTTSPRFAGLLGGGKIGYNYQVGKWGVGIEGDAGVTNTRGARPCPTGFFYNCEINTYWLATATARAAQRGICRVAAQACFALGEPSCLHIVVDLAVRDSDLAALATGTTKLRHRSIEPLLACAQLPTDPPPRIAIRRRASSAPKARSK